jgi:3-oxoacyl-[acyl-carrier-protein] synthase III
MLHEVYITKLSKYLPNNPVFNDDMEDFLGFINNKRSKAKNIVLRNNGIKKRYYSIDKNGTSTHTNAELTVEAIKGLLSNDYTVNDIELLACGTTSPDQILPGHASMVHGLIKGGEMETISHSGSCNSGMQALKYVYLSVLSGDKSGGIATGSEKLSSWMQAGKFQQEVNNLAELEENPMIAFEKDFLRWMLSDGACAALLQNKPNKNALSLKIEWIDMHSFANEVETCMFAGSLKNCDGTITGWAEIEPEQWLGKSVFSLKQDIKLLDKNIVKLSVRKLKDVLLKRKLNLEQVDYFLFHISSMYFKQKIADELKENDLAIPDEKWFINLPEVGNVGSASIFLMLEELFHSGKLKKGQKIFLSVPESARFSYAYSLLTVC